MEIRVIKLLSPNYSLCHHQQPSMVEKREFISIPSKLEGIARNELYLQHWPIVSHIRLHEASA
jgi:hypothetical protein